MNETLGAASRREYINLICVECVAYCSYFNSVCKWFDRPKFWNETHTSSLNQSCFLFLYVLVTQLVQVTLRAHPVGSVY